MVQKSPTSGICIHFGSMSWTSLQGLGGEGLDSQVVCQLVDNAIQLLESKDPSSILLEKRARETVSTNLSLKKNKTDLDDTKFCIICGCPVDSFKLHKGRPRSCPSCGSSERVRTFAKAYKNKQLDIELRNKKMLLISPSSSELKFLNQIQGLLIETTDIRPQVKPDILADICCMPQIHSNVYDVIYASCVLNCVYDLNAALAEIRRILKPNGVFLNVEMLNSGQVTIERNDLNKITEYYGQDTFEKYRVGGYRSFGELDYHKILEKYFQVNMSNVFDDPYKKTQRWHICRKS